MSRIHTAHIIYIINDGFQVVTKKILKNTQKKLQAVYLRFKKIVKKE